jgi:hypothetical protein
MLTAGTVALFYCFVWVFLLSMQGRTAEPAQPLPRWRRWAFALFMLVNLAVLVSEDGSDSGLALSGLVELVVVVPGLAALFVVVRRATAAGTFPRARSAPAGMFWVCVVVSGLALAVAVTSLAEQIVLGHSC